MDAMGWVDLKGNLPEIVKSTSEKKTALWPLGGQKRCLPNRTMDILIGRDGEQ